MVSMVFMVGEWGDCGDRGLVDWHRAEAGEDW